MKRWCFLKLLDSIDEVADGAASHAQLRLLFKVQKASFKVVWLEGKISIEFDQELPILSLKMLVAVVECFHDAATRLSIAAVLTVHAFDPRVTRRILVNDASCTVSGAVIHNDPLRGADGLAEHAVESLTRGEPLRRGQA